MEQRIFRVEEIKVNELQCSVNQVVLKASFFYFLKALAQEIRQNGKFEFFLKFVKIFLRPSN